MGRISVDWNLHLILSAVLSLLAALLSLCTWYHFSIWLRLVTLVTGMFTDPTNTFFSCECKALWNTWKTSKILYCTVNTILDMQYWVWLWLDLSHLLITQVKLSSRLLVTSVLTFESTVKECYCILPSFSFSLLPCIMKRWCFQLREGWWTQTALPRSTSHTSVCWRCVRTASCPGAVHKSICRGERQRFSSVFRDLTQGGGGMVMWAGVCQRLVFRCWDITGKVQGGITHNSIQEWYRTRPQIFTLNWLNIYNMYI